MSEDTGRFERCISGLINTSVCDAQSSLSHYTTKDIGIVQEALKRAKELGRGKTLIKLLESKARRLEKQAAQEAVHGA